MRAFLSLVVILALLGSAIARPPAPKPTPLPNLPKDQLCAAGFIPAYYNKQNLGELPVVSAPSAVLMDFDTGEILYAKGPDTRRYPASTTKIMTALLLAENTEPTDRVVCNNPFITEVGESSLFIQKGDLFTAQALLYGFMLKSANDGGVVIAEHVAGSVPRFAELMTARAKELGAKNSHFMNPHGLHNKEHYTTARDLALIAREAMRNEKFADAVSVPRRTISRTNAAGQPVLTVVQSKGKKAFYDVVLGADGIKTGFTNPAKHCFVGSATRGGRRLIAVSLAASSNSCADCAALIEWGFARFPAQAVAKKDQPAGEVSVGFGEIGTVPVVAKSSLRVANDILGGRSIEKRIVATTNSAPIQKGQEVGQLVALVNGKELARTPLLATKSVGRSVVKAAARTSAVPGAVAVGIVGAGALALVGVKNGRDNARRRAARSAAKSTGRRRGRGAA
jgi:serine-type D-Ala-D-Ala carboxypeptidase (penicillin-binding protein 5/6)